MFRFSVEISFVLLLCATVAPDSACKVVVLTLAAYPTSIWEREIFFFDLIFCILCLPLIELRYLLFSARNLFFLFVLGPFKRSYMEIFVFLCLILLWLVLFLSILLLRLLFRLLIMSLFRLIHTWFHVFILRDTLFIGWLYLVDMFRLLR